RNAHSDNKTIPQRPAVLELAEQKLEAWLELTLVPVINATGVILHTNLGRAPLSRSALQAIRGMSAGYCSLEYRLNTGQRGERSEHVETLIKMLTGAEAALVVNNNAGAILLALSALARRRQVIVSRTQLVAIGGGFRVPEIMRQSGARLVEVGTTNQVRLEDYKEALRDSTALLLHVHHSNFKIIGFMEEPSLSDLVELGKRYEIPVIDDLGSGALLDTARFGLAHEPMVQESLAAGAELVCFSGDKLLGGPQSGILVGRAELIQKIKRHPLARPLRADKLCLAALSATLLHYLKDEAEREIPVWQMITATPEELKARATHWKNILQAGEVIPGESTIGGGSLPGETLPTFLLALSVSHPALFLKRLREVKPPIIARILDNRVVLDPRTVTPDQEGALLVGLQNALGHKA
ncbi:MAG: L-seryl-tRNA(Sec) selenium transferase, partial [Anaerolineales bacterium]